MRPSKSLLAILALTCFAYPVLAQDTKKAEMPVTQNAADPLEISADNALEWDRAGKKYIAKGNAIAKQKDMEVHADTLIAEYRETKEKSSDIYKLTATGNVVLISGGVNKAYGNNAVYEIDIAKATLTGGDLRIESPEMKITAKEKFEYYSNEGKMVAYGDPVITNKDSTLTADLITAWTNPEAKKEEKATASSDKPASRMGNIKRAEAEGNVVITTPKDKATADKGIYTSENDTVELLGNVKLHQGENMLQGIRADMNLTTNLSRVYGAKGKGGRVKGVFFPSSQKKDK